MSEKEKYPEIWCEDFLEATARNLTLLKKLRCSAASEIQSPIHAAPSQAAAAQQSVTLLCPMVSRYAYVIVQKERTDG